MISKQDLINDLPPYQDKWIMINPNQAVKDIIEEVCEAHEEFAPYYDNIALYFDGYDNREISERIFSFLKTNIKYKEETDKHQTSALPTGILVRGIGDCKHYSGFSAGVLDALNRQGKKIKWCYRFASYRIFDKTPHHVFVVINPGGKEIWIDPTPNAEKMKPVWQVDKKVNTMLQRNIAGIGEFLETKRFHSIGIASLDVYPHVNGDNNLNWDGTNRYAGVFNPYLGLTMYRDLGGDRNINENEVARLLNIQIAMGPHPGHTVPGDFVKWVYNSNIRSWNFYYPNGVRPDFTAETLLPVEWPRLVITPDYRLTFDRDVKIDDWRNAPIHLLTAWAQALINKYDTSPYPVKPQHLKEFSQLKTGNVETRNLFNEARGASIFKEIGKALENALNFVKDGVIKVVGSIPRNAFLVLVGLNIFKLGTKLQKSIDSGGTDKLKNLWEKLGGNFDKLLNTIKDGSKKPDPGIDENSTAVIAGGINRIGVAAEGTAAVIIAAAAPIIAAMLALIKDDDGKLQGVLQATKAAAQQLFPDLDLDAYGFLDTRTGKRFDFEVDDRDNENLGGGNDLLPGTGGSFDLSAITKNPMLAAAGVGAALYLIPKKKNIMLAAIAAAATYYLLNQNQQQPQKLLGNG